jgi:hypothetical protein
VWRWCSSVVCEAVQHRLLRVYLKSCACEHARTGDGRSVSCVVSDNQGKNIKWTIGQLKYVDNLNSVRQTYVRTYSEHVLSTRLFGVRQVASGSLPSRGKENVNRKRVTGSQGLHLEARYSAADAGIECQNRGLDSRFAFRR